MKEDSWINKQYYKIQSYVIENNLYKNQPDNLSHADIIIKRLEKLERRHHNQPLNLHGKERQAR